jgi:hypothetical protein
MDEKMSRKAYRYSESGVTVHHADREARLVSNRTVSQSTVTLKGPQFQECRVCQVPALPLMFCNFAAALASWVTCTHIMSIAKNDHDYTGTR